MAKENKGQGFLFLGRGKPGLHEQSQLDAVPGNKNVRPLRRLSEVAAFAMTQVIFTKNDKTLLC